MRRETDPAEWAEEVDWASSSFIIPLLYKIFLGWKPQGTGEDRRRTAGDRRRLLGAFWRTVQSQFSILGHSSRQFSLVVYDDSGLQNHCGNQLL